MHGFNVHSNAVTSQCQNEKVKWQGKTKTDVLKKYKNSQNARNR